MKRLTSVIFTLLLLTAATVPTFAQTQPAEQQEKPSATQRVISWYNDHLNYGTITLLMTVESSFIPFPSEVIVRPPPTKPATATTPRCTSPRRSSSTCVGHRVRDTRSPHRSPDQLRALPAVGPPHHLLVRRQQSWAHAAVRQRKSAESRRLLPGTR